MSISHQGTAWKTTCSSWTTTRRRHRGNGLEILAPVDDAGRFTDVVKEFAGQHVFKANPKIVELLQANGRLAGPWVVEPFLSPLLALQESRHLPGDRTVVRVDGDQRSSEGGAWRRSIASDGFQPWGKDRINGMIDNRPDWCLSRQRVWGVPIPGFTCTACRRVLADPMVIEHVATIDGVEGGRCVVRSNRRRRSVAAGHRPVPKCGGTDFEKERDILDVWFESGVSYAAVLKPRKWWPADLYLEGSDQHRGWFHSALLAGVVTDRRAPYEAVLTHGFVLDGQGKKMSKSAGNVVAPQDVIKQSGAEILRLWVSAQDYRDDVRISPEILNHLIEAYRKIRNTCRFLLSNLYDFDPAQSTASPMSNCPNWIAGRCMRLEDLKTRVRRSL